MFIVFIPIIALPIILFIYKYYILFLIVILVYYTLNFWSLLSSYKNKRSDIQTKITWTVTQFLFPGMGAYTYYSFGRVPRKIKKELLKSELLENEILKSYDSSADSVEILNGGSETYPEIIKEIKNAKYFINMQYFIINPGIIYEKIIDALNERIKAGVEVRIIYDYLGSVNLSEQEINRLKKIGIKIVVFKKINWLKANGTDNWRNHNKTIVIDNDVVFFGGINIGDEYSGLLGKYGNWIDAHYKLTGKIASDFNSIFIVSWHISTKENISTAFKNTTNLNENDGNSYKLKILYDSPDRDIPVTFERLKYQIEQAKQKINIITPYVAFPYSFKQKIREAINRGVEVNIITIGLADKKSAYYQGTFDAQTLTMLGAKIYRTEKTFVHTKMFIFDNETVIFGTTNLDYRALFQHFETNLELTSDKVNDFSNYFEELKELSNIDVKNRNDWSIFKSVEYTFIRLFKGLF